MKMALSMARNEPGRQVLNSLFAGAQPELDFGGKRNPDGAGFAAFGKVTRVWWCGKITSPQKSKYYHLTFQ
jgi:hypothetical protein